MPTSEAQRLVYRDEFRSRFNEDFQSWFSQLARALHPSGDFQEIHNTQGDGGFDGFSIENQQVYQVYAPSRRHEDRDSETASKIRGDFAKAFSHLGKSLKEWTFVHNHPTASLGKLSVVAVSDLKERYQAINITVLDIESLWDRLCLLPDDALSTFFGPSVGSLVEFNIRHYDPDGSPGALLRADHDCAVPFHGREGEMSDLLGWAASEPLIAIRLYTGAGGMGKSRLCVELCKKLKGQNWQVGFLKQIPSGQTPEGVARQLPVQTRSLVIVDYAETRRDEIVTFLKAALFQKEQGALRNPMRVILLARDRKDWWTELQAAAAGTDELLTGKLTRTFSLGPVATTLTQGEAAFKTALNHFASLFDKQISMDLLPENLVPDEYRSILVLQFAALARTEGVEVRGEGGVLHFALLRERRYWTRMAESRGLPPSLHKVIAQAMAAITLGGGCSNDQEALEVARQLPELADQPTAIVSSLLSLLHDSYPGKKYIEPIEPDLLGEQLIEEEWNDTITEIVFGTRDEFLGGKNEQR